MIVANTSRTILRHFIPSDAAAMTTLFGDPAVMQFGDGPQDDAWVGEWIARTIADYAHDNLGLWAIVLHGTECPIGYCGLTRFTDVNGAPEIELGYRLAKEHWGQGIATEAAAAIRDLAFRQWNIGRLISLIDPGNHRSIRVAEKLGMRHTDDAMLPGYTHPDRVYSITRDLNQS